MGGHGGLNILPQKKWNVYNYDNRAIVDKDKKEAAAKKRAEYERNRQNGLQGKLDVLKEEMGIVPQAENKKHSLLSQELLKLNEKQKHINLFQREQQIIENRELTQAKRLQEAEFLKGKDTMDLSSKFLGTYADDNAKPWYSKQKGTHQEKSKRKQYFMEKNRQDERVKRQAVKESNEQVERSREKKTKKELNSDVGEKSEIQRMREKRLRREEKERERVRKAGLA